MPRALTHSRITWALSSMAPQVLDVTLGSLLCPWCCRHFSKIDAQYNTCLWKEVTFETQEDFHDRINISLNNIIPPIMPPLLSIEASMLVEAMGSLVQQKLTKSSF